MLVTADALMYQWADTTRMARGLGIAAPKSRQASVYRLWSRAFIGVPWPRNAAGIVDAIGVVTNPSTSVISARGDPP